MAPSVALPIALYRKGSPAPDPVTLVQKTADSKTGPISVGWKSLYSCPVGCQHLQDGTCYSLHGTCKFTTYRLTSCAEHDPETICKRSAELILGLASTVRRRDAEKIRLNISGDSPFPQHEAKSAEVYMAKTGKAVYAYTHCLTTPRSLWGKISVLASLDTWEQSTKAIRRQLRVARKHGYKGFSVTTDHHDGAGIYTDTRTGLKTIACRHDLTKSVTCRDCNLCEEGTMQRGGYQAVAFAMKHAK